MRRRVWLAERNNSLLAHDVTLLREVRFGRLDTNPVTSRRDYSISTIAPRGAIRDPCSLNSVSRSEETYSRRNLFFGCVPSETITRGASMPFSQKPEQFSFSDILGADEVASAASRMVRSFVRILTLLIVATLSFAVGVYVGPTKQGKELRALITARITSLPSELHRKIEEVKTAPEEAARPTAPASGEPESGPLALSPNKPSATPAPTMEGGKTVAAPAETPLSPSGPSDSTAVDLVPVTQKMEGEIQGLQAKVAALEKARNSSLEELSRRIDDAKSKTK